MNNKGQMAMYEFLIILILLGVAGWATYEYVHKPSENSIYQAGSKPVISDYHMSPFSCVREGKDGIFSNQVSH